MTDPATDAEETFTLDYVRAAMHSLGGRVTDRDVAVTQAEALIGIGQHLDRLVVQLDELVYEQKLANLLAMLGSGIPSPTEREQLLDRLRRETGVRG